MTTPVARPLGAVMLDVGGKSLAAAEREMLAHPQAGGVILFARNYESPEQLKALVSEIRSVREPQLLIAVDHEGGRVQRFRAGFTPIPPMGDIGKVSSDEDARRAARAAGIVIASELVSHGVDFSFAPVLDIDYGRCSAIGSRAFASNAARVAILAEAFMLGLRSAGAAAVGKHFPGHGFVEADSHLAIPVDERPYGELERSDLVPYACLIPRGLDGIMPAHVIFPAVDARPAGFSARWLKQILRGRLGFHGLIFSDDLSMEGASFAGDIVDRGRAALEAGCDMVLVCNKPEAAGQLLEKLDASPLWPYRATRMRARPGSGEEQYRLALDQLRSLIG